ncbi:LysR family transcriptional regulator [Oscillospiraceae bacterium MB08-C2-2]|nr:LysR family transcriptional regulator [Oscillospiraceae bacterium MB08-C2-2]
MTIQKLRYIIEIVGSGSMSEAAKRLFITQPSLSGMVKELEEQLGFTIFLRTNKGVTLSQEGAEFLGYARQVVEQTDLLEQRYLHVKPSRQLLSVSTQHYAFVVQAFVRLIEEFGADEYEFTFRDTRTHEILEDVRTLRSEIGVIYMNDFNEKVLSQILRQYGLEFHKLFTAKPHIFVGASNPLAQKKAVTLEDLEEYPCLSFEQGEYNSFYYSEEILSTLVHKKSIRVSDRATIFNLMIGLGGYTISTGVINADLNGSDIVSVPLLVDETITVGWIAHKSVTLSRLAEQLVIKLEEAAQASGYIG